MRVLTSTDEHPGHATEAALEAEEESKQHLVSIFFILPRAFIVSDHAFILDALLFKSVHVYDKI